MMKAEFFRDARNDLSGPLAGVHVVEATTTAAGPLCAAMLADLGAEVIKVETPEGEVSRRLPPVLPGTNIGFVHGTINRNKRSLSLDLRRREGRDIFLKLAAKADIVVENFKPGTMDKWGVGYHAVRAVKARHRLCVDYRMGPIRSVFQPARLRSDRASSIWLHVAERLGGWAPDQGSDRDR